MTTIYGLCGGLSAVVFEVSITLFYNGTFLRFAKFSAGEFLAASFGVIVVSSLIAGSLLSRFCPGAAGSGIPQLKLAFWKDFGYVPSEVVRVNFVAGILTVGGGASLGREGPTVQLAGGLSSQLAGRGSASLWKVSASELEGVAVGSSDRQADRVRRQPPQATSVWCPAC